MIVGILGLSFNLIALVVFLRLGRTKPYYVIAIFETLTDLITSMVAVYSGVFLVTGNIIAAGESCHNFNEHVML